MDTSSETSNALDTNQAGVLLASLIDTAPKEPEAKESEPEKAEPPAEPEKVEEAPAEEAQKFTVKIDGKDVELTHEQIAEAYKNGLRQDDYTRKTMATAAERKAAEAETAKAREERHNYANGLQQNHALLTAALQEQQKIDWHALREADPVEFLKQQHLHGERQAALQETRNRLQQVNAMEQAEKSSSLVTHIQTEQQELIAKLPDWKDDKKAGAEKKAIAEDLISRGFDFKQVFGEPNRDGSVNPNAPGIIDHKLILLARDAYLYRQLTAKASTEAKRVQNLPQKTLTPGSGESQSLDKRSAEWNRFAKSGRVEDAAAVFARLL